MLICPNKNLKEWKDLVASVGENRAMLMWYESEGKVGFTLSAQTTILDNLSKVNNWFKQMKDTNAFWNKLQKDLQIPKEQISLLKESNGKTIEEKLTNFVVNYSYTVEINTAKDELTEQKQFSIYEKDGRYYVPDFDTGGEPTEITKEQYEESLKVLESKNSDYYSNLSAPGGTGKNKYEGNPDWEYQELEISTPLITPSIKGHAQFATANGIGWARVWYNKKTGTVEIQEIQSDLFQKGRDKEKLVGDETDSDGNSFYGTDGIYSNYIKGEYLKEDKEGNIIKITKEQYEKEKNIRFGNSKENQFLQLLNKDNNWVTFFIKSIIQDSAKKGYNKVLFPTGNTASKVEGHTTLEEFKKQKEDRIKELKKKEEINKATYIENEKEVVRLSEKLKTYNFLTKSDLGYIYNKEEKTVNLINKTTNEDVLLSHGYWANNKISKNVNTETEAKAIFNRFINGEKIEENHYFYSIEQIEELKLKELIERKLNSLKSKQEALKTGESKEIAALEQELERVETEGFGALKPIYNFYENTVTNILKKQGLNPVLVTDEYGNTWNEVELLDDLLENFTIGSFKPRIPIPVPINNSLEELYKEDVENSNNNCTFDTGK